MANMYVGNEDCLFLNIYTHKVGLYVIYFLELSLLKYREM